MTSNNEYNRIKKMKIFIKTIFIMNSARVIKAPESIY